MDSPVHCVQAFHQFPLIIIIIIIITLQFRWGREMDYNWAESEESKLIVSKSNSELTIHMHACTNNYQFPSHCKNY